MAQGLSKIERPFCQTELTTPVGQFKILHSLQIANHPQLVFTFGQMCTENTLGAVMW